MTGNSRHLSRRSISALIAGAAAWPCSGAALPILPTTTMKGLLLSILEQPASAYTIGLAYLDSLPPDARAADRLANAIVCAAGCDSGTMRSTDALRKQISIRVRKDFAEGAVVIVAGWVLSETEAQLYALAALGE
jgi:hypothetical protein